MCKYILMTDEVKVDTDVLENAKLCAEQGFKGTFVLISGEVIQDAYITGYNWEEKVVTLERVGERHLDPRVLYLIDVQRIDLKWG